jgi:hypothetical protein
MKSTSFLAARGNLTFDATGAYRTHPQGAPSFSQLQDHCRKRCRERVVNQFAATAATKSS